MSKENNLIVGGYVFSSEEDAELARQETKKIEYLESRMDYKLPENILAVYLKALDNKIMQTPIGWEYLRKLQIRMIEDGLNPGQIPPIPLYSVFAHKVNGAAYTGVARQRVKVSVKKDHNQEKDKYRSRFQTAVIVSAGLLLLVAAMFFITIKSDNPNIINYEKAILNKYAAWAEELSERERAVREKEIEFNLNE